MRDTPGLADRRTPAPIAATRSSTLRVDTPCTYASHTTACKALSIRRRGASSDGMNEPAPQLRDRDRHITGGGRHGLVPGPVALGHPLRGPLVAAGTDPGLGLGVDDAMNPQHGVRRPFDHGAEPRQLPR